MSITTRTWSANDSDSNLNVFDEFNRIENNIVIVRALIETFSNTVSTLGDKTNWSRADMLYYTELNRIENNIKAMKDITYQPLIWTTPRVWVSEIISFTDMNRIEQNILNLYSMVNGMIAELNLYRCGKAICGGRYL
jgi:hypothetical protein